MKTRALLIVVLSAVAAPAMATIFVPQSASPATSAAAPGGAQAPALAPGLHVQVIDGTVSLSNQGGAQQFVPGQFGYAGSFVAAPVLVPRTSAVQFTPPPMFSGSTPSNTSTATKSNSVECEVR